MPAASRAAAKAKSDPIRRPPAAQPTPKDAAQNPVRRRAALRRFRAATTLIPGWSWLVVGLVDVREPARRPMVGRSVAAARAVQRRDVLERHEDMPVQLDVGDVLDVAVRSEHALLVLAAEEGDLDLLALVLARVVLHGFSLLPGDSPSRRRS